MHPKETFELHFVVVQSHRITIGLQRFLLFQLLIVCRAIATKIVEEKQLVDGSTVYLVKFLGENKLQWVDEVSDDLLCSWIAQKQPARESQLMALADGPPAISTTVIKQSDTIAVDEAAIFAAKSIADMVQQFLRGRINFSLKNPRCCTPKHTIRLHLMPEVLFLILLP